MDRKNDIQRLKNEADIESVVNFLGINVVKRGNANFILCPNPAHDDHKASNCYFKTGWNNVYCTACCESTNAIDLIINTLHCSYGEAADILWEIEGCPEWYYVEKKSYTKPKFFLTKEEAEFIGFKQYINIDIPVNVSLVRNELPKHQHFSRNLLPDDDTNIVCETVHLSYSDFMTQEVYESMVKQKLLDLQKRATVIEKKYQYSVNPIYDALCNIAIDEKKRCDLILQRLESSKIS